MSILAWALAAIGVAAAVGINFRSRWGLAGIALVHAVQATINARGGYAAMAVLYALYAVLAVVGIWQWTRRRNAAQKFFERWKSPRFDYLDPAKEPIDLRFTDISEGYMDVMEHLRRRMEKDLDLRVPEAMFTDEWSEEPLLRGLRKAKDKIRKFWHV